MKYNYSPNTSTLMFESARQTDVPAIMETLEAHSRVGVHGLVFKDCAFMDLSIPQFVENYQFHKVCVNRLSIEASRVMFYESSVQRSFVNAGVIDTLTIKESIVKIDAVKVTILRIGKRTRILGAALCAPETVELAADYTHDPAKRDEAMLMCGLVRNTVFRAKLALIQAGFKQQAKL